VERALQRSWALLNVTETSMDRVTAPPDGAIGPPVFTDGFGSRFLGVDPEAGDPIEILVFDPELVAAPDFASTVGVRVARLSGARHTLFARVRRIDRPSPDSLLLVSDRVAGWRLSDVLDLAHREGLGLDISAVLSLLRQLIPAVTLFGRHQRHLSVGTIAPERLILTPQGRLVIAEYVLGEAIEKLSLTREHLWRAFRVPVAAVAGAPREAPRSDALGIGIVALSLLLGRRLREEEFPDALADLLEQATETHEGIVRPLTPRLSSFLARALQLDGHKALQSPKDAQVAFEEVLASERGYVTSPALLDAFVTRFEQMAGPPPEIARPVEEPPPPPPPPSAPREEWLPEPAARVELPLTVPDPVEEPVPPAAALEAPPRAQEIEPEEQRAGAPAEEAPAVVPIPAAVSTPRTDAELAGETVGGGAGETSRGWMTKALAVFALLVVLEAVAIMWLWNQSAAALLRDGELSVQSRPPSARVMLDDDELGVTPVTVRLSPGTYTLKVQAGNAEPRVIVVQIRAGVQTAQYLELQTDR
jgi:outer membrane biosynthesis protein TonB